MRCLVCNANLNDFESTRKHATTGEYLDTCSDCLNAIGLIPTLDREDLMQNEGEIDIDRIEGDCY